MTMFHLIPLRMRNVSDKTVEKIKTHILCSIPYSENRAVYNMEKCGGSGQTTGDNRERFTRYAYWITKGKNM